MSSVKNLLSQQVSRSTYQNGQKLYHARHVVFVDHFDGGYCALVEGSRGNTYRLTFSARLTASDCDCPVHTRCKHFAAAVFAAEAKGLFETTPKQRAFVSKEVTEFDLWLNTVKAEYQFSVNQVDQRQPDQHVRYVLLRRQGEWVLELRRVKRLSNGEWSKGDKISLATFEDMQYFGMHPKDQQVLEAMNLGWGFKKRTFYDLSQASAPRVLIEAVRAGHCYIATAHGQQVTYSNYPNHTDVKWQDNGYYQLELLLNGRPFDPETMVLVDNFPALAIDTKTAELFSLPEYLNVDLVNSLVQLPELSPNDLHRFMAWLKQNQVDLPLPEVAPAVELNEPPQTHVEIHHDGARFYARVFHYYGEFNFEFGKVFPAQGQLVEVNGQLYNWHRQLEAEQAHLAWLNFNLGFYDVNYKRHGEDFYRFVTESPDDWCLLAQLDFSDYHQHGIYLQLCTDEPLPTLVEVSSYNGEVLADEYGDWFELGLHVELDGKSINLVELLMSALGQYDNIDQLPETLFLNHENDLVQISAETAKPILRVLQQLGDDSGRIPRHHAGALNDIPFVDQWSGDSKIRQIADKLNDFDGIEPVKPPEGLQANLRDYQQQGVNWINFLQEYGFAGILADDMGLGKTVQALAIMQRMVELGQLTLPIMVVCPTSLVGNWRSEAQKFAPSLKVLVLQGADRKQYFDQIADYHLVISTYPLMNHDFDVLSQQRYQWLVLDEAQVIKNPKAKMTQNIKQLQANHKLCLTGTPMENHLGELWCLFDFLMPGYLGAHDSFKKLYQRPIEQGEDYAQDWLNKRVNPFMLRRTKEHVATELPAKTEIIQRLELGKAQRKLYESIRVTMESKVRQLIAEKGIAKSQIEFLDALLKIRQACCHPQLVKLDEAKKMTSSAKLDFLLETLPEMLEEGRKILIFSQFATMLGIIETELKKAGIKTTKLTGQTRKRQEKIEAFTSGAADVFLISLKAGGVGLNLTQADTVIHFDPWWNPAAENQATDRAYRIGQDKPVFVYKLVTENTIEERVLALQERKSAMAKAVYGEQTEQVNELNQMSADQLLELFS